MRQVLQVILDRRELLDNLVILETLGRLGGLESGVSRERLE